MTNADRIQLVKDLVVKAGLSFDVAWRSCPSGFSFMLFRRDRRPYSMAGHSESAAGGKTVFNRKNAWTWMYGHSGYRCYKSPTWHATEELAVIGFLRHFMSFETGGWDVNESLVGLYDCRKALPRRPSSEEELAIMLAAI